MKQLLDMYQYILDNGEHITNGRTKEGYYSIFGYQNRYNLRDGFPVTTTKKLFFKGVKVENTWFIKGDTNIKYLQDHGVHIWDDWATAEQTAKFGRPEGDLGPVYGKLWRRWEAVDASKYVHFNMRNTNRPNETFWGVKYIDQLSNVIEQIKTNPSSRRLIVTGWNPATCDLVALPPCHTLFQFKVSHGGTRLNCQLYQRSADAFLGVPFNIASYALLTHMVAQVCDLEVGEFVHTFGDLHIYENHLDQVKEQLTRQPYPLPKLWLNPEIKDINKFTPDDIQLIDYKSHPSIKGEVAV
jgi:thymidylate synthase